MFAGYNTPLKKIYPKLESSIMLPPLLKQSNITEHIKVYKHYLTTLLGRRGTILKIHI